MRVWARASFYEFLRVFTMPVLCGCVGVLILLLLVYCHRPVDLQSAADLVRHLWEISGLWTSSAKCGVCTVHFSSATCPFYTTTHVPKITQHHTMFFLFWTSLSRNRHAGNWTSPFPTFWYCHMGSAPATDQLRIEPPSKLSNVYVDCQECCDCAHQ